MVAPRHMWWTTGADESLNGAYELKLEAKT